MKRKFTFGVLLLLALVARPAAAQTCTLTDTSISFGITPARCSTAPLPEKSRAPAHGTFRSMPDWARVPPKPSERYGTPKRGKVQLQVFQADPRTINWGNTTGAELTGTGNTNITFYGKSSRGNTSFLARTPIRFLLDTTNFSVTATVVKDCAVTATNLAFGNYTGAQVRSTSTITATCTSSTTYTVGLNAGPDPARRNRADARGPEKSG